MLARLKTLPYSSKMSLFQIRALRGFKVRNSIVVAHIRNISSIVTLKYPLYTTELLTERIKILKYCDPPNTGYFN